MVTKCSHCQSEAHNKLCTICTEHGCCEEHCENGYIMKSLRVWTNTTFKGHYPVGTSAIVIAPDADAAAGILNRELERIGLTSRVESCNMKPQPLIYGWVDILNDGEY